MYRVDFRQNCQHSHFSLSSTEQMQALGQINPSCLTSDTIQVTNNNQIYLTPFHFSQCHSLVKVKCLLWCSCGYWCLPWFPQFLWARISFWMRLKSYRTWLRLSFWKYKTPSILKVCVNTHLVAMATYGYNQAWKRGSGDNVRWSPDSFNSPSKGIISWIISSSVNWRWGLGNAPNSLSLCFALSPDNFLVLISSSMFSELSNDFARGIRWGSLISCGLEMFLLMSNTAGRPRGAALPSEEGSCSTIPLASLSVKSSRNFWKQKPQKVVSFKKAW